ncbi:MULTISPECIES: ABC transporter permease [Salinibaculum]|uniref:ABC transporter permease n=1 Tax=Salinibaculum TaxID=2732368 RepID=UPI0030D28B98
MASDSVRWSPTARSNSLEALVSRRVLLPGFVFVTLLVLWEFALPALGVQSYLLPTPSRILAALLGEYPTIVGHLVFTLKAFAVGFSLTVVSGYLLALAMSQSKVLETTLFPYVVIARSIPVITLLPLFIVWLGFGFASIVAISYLISFFAMVVNSLAGFKSTDEELVNMVRSFSATKREVFRNVHLYSSLPYVFAGIKIAVILAFTGVIVGEFLVGTDGIGYLILQYNNSLATPEMYASVLVVSLTQLLLFGIVVGIERRVVTWDHGNGTIW